MPWLSYTDEYLAGEAGFEPAIARLTAACLTCLATLQKMERIGNIEIPHIGWKPTALPLSYIRVVWLRWSDLNRRSLGYEPSEIGRFSTALKGAGRQPGLLRNIVAPCSTSALSVRRLLELVPRSTTARR